MPPVIIFLRSCKQIRDNYSANEISVYAAQASFFIILSVFPFLMFLLTLLQYIPTLEADTLIDTLKLLTPETLHGLLTETINSLSVKAPGAIASAAALSALWSSGKGVMSIERGLNRIYGYTDPRGYILRRIFCACYTFVFAASCLAALTLLVLGESIHRLMLMYLPFIEGLTHRILDLGGLLSFALLLAAFLSLYTFLPWKKQNPWHQLPGAVFSAAGWIGSSFLFSIYFQHFHSFSRIYGSLAAVVLAMLWLYAGICILFLGAEINCCVRECFG